MPLLDDPTVTSSLLVPRGYVPLAGTDEETHPVKPPVEDTNAPSFADKALSIFQSTTPPPGSTLIPGIGYVGGDITQEQRVGRAAFRQNNTVVSAITRYGETAGVSNDLVDPNYSPWEDVAGTPYEKYWRGTFAGSNNRQYTEALKRSIDRQEADRRTVEAGGALGVVSGIVAGAVDPTLLVPVGGEVSLAGRGVWRLSKGALQGARAGAIGTAAYETALQGSQDTRTAQESYINIGTGVVLGAVIGGSIAGVLSRTQRVGSEEALEQIANAPIPGSVGAAAPRHFTLDDMTINGKITENIAAGTAFSPNLRGNFRESPLARQTYQELATNTLRQNMHDVGLSLGPSVETNINVSLGETIGQALQQHPEIFVAGKKAGFGMSGDMFDNSIGRAMRRGDQGENEFVTKAAQMWRKQVVDPLTQQAIDLKMLPEDVSVTEAPSYFSRMYNTEKMVAQKPRFMQITTDHFHEVLQNKYADALETLQRKLADLEEEKSVAQLKPKARDKKLGELGDRGEKLREKFAKVDKFDEHVASVEQKKKDLTRSFLDQWEIKRLGENIDTNQERFLAETFYHGTTRKFEGLPGKSHGRGGIVVYATDPEVASRYAGKQLVKEHGTFGEQRVFPVKIKSKDIADFRKPEDIEKVRKYLAEQHNAMEEKGLNPEPFSMDSVKAGEWSIWEDADMLKALGWKGAYITEHGKGAKELNLALLDPKHAVSKFDEQVRKAPDFSTHANDMAQDVYDSITGNDYGSASVDPAFHLAAKSGPLKDRTFHIPDEKIEDFLEDNVTKVMSRFARTMSAQIELARKFPDDPVLTNRFKQIKDEYDILVNAAKSDAERTKLQKDMKGTFRDLRALVEIHRGNYMAKENASSWGRAVRGTMLFNYIRSMGGSVLPSVADIYGPAIFHGFTKTMDVGATALAKAVSKNGQLIKEARYAGVAERLGHHRLLTLTEIGDPYANGTAVERLLENGSKIASKWNGLNMLTDFQKDFDSIVVQHRINQGLIKGQDEKFLAYSGMTPDLRSKVAKQLEQHMTEEDGISVANTDQWDDFDAVRAYRAAVNFNVNADIVTRGIGDVPLAAYHPLGKMFLQFKTFNLAAHQRTFLRASQLGPAQFLSGLIGLTTIGMFASYLKAMRGGEESFKRFNKAIENKGYWVGEGLDATGFFTLPIEVSNIAERATERAGYKINPVKTPLMLAGRAFNPDASMQGQSLARPGQRTLAEALGGPSLALLEDIPVGAGGTVVDKLKGEEQTSTHQRALNRIIPYQSYIGMRELLQVMEHNSPYVDNK